MKCLKTCCTLLIICLLPLSSHAREIDRILLFGDSLSDGNGDNAVSSDSAHSTYNLLRTLAGVEVDGKPPMNISKVISRRSTIETIRLNLEGLEYELKAERKDAKSWARKGMLLWEQAQLELFGGMLVKALEMIDKLEGAGDQVLVSLLTPIKDFLEERLQHTGENGNTRPVIATLLYHVNLGIKFAEADFSDMVLDACEEELTDITTKFGTMIPLIPDKNHYVEGKWIAGNRDMDQTWVEHLGKMMSTPDHQVTVENRAMAGSWTLCAANKIGHLSTLTDTATNPKELIKLLFQGSLVPPCQGLIVRSCLKERRAAYKEQTQQEPDLDTPIFDPKTLVIFFNSANDFLNQWQDPEQVAQEMANDVRHILRAGAQQVVVVLLPDIASTPRYQSEGMQNSGEAAEISKLVTEYNNELEERVAQLRKDFNAADVGTAGSRCLITIKAQDMFDAVLNSPDWDTTHPILDIPIPGMGNDPDTKREDLLATTPDENIINRQLYENRAFTDNWSVKGASGHIDSAKKPYYSDTVHPSPAGHRDIAERVCQMVLAHGIHCSQDNFTQDEAIRECSERRNAVFPTAAL